MKNFSMPHFHQFSSGSFNFLVLNLGLPLDKSNKIHAVIKGARRVGNVT